MQVRKEGSVPSREEYFKDTVVVCAAWDEHDSSHHCGAELQFQEADLLPRFWKASHSDKFYFVVICPRCGGYCRVNPPGPVFQELMTQDMRTRATWDGFGSGL